MSPRSVAERSADLDQLTTDRRVALRLLWTLDDPRTPIEVFARVSSADPALTARLLVAGSASFFGAPKATTISRAVSLLGPQTVRTIASAAALQLFGAPGPTMPDATWLHAVTAGVAGAKVAPYFNVTPAVALSTAVIHDIGTMMLFTRDPQLFAAMEATAKQSPGDRIALECDHFGVDHATLAAQILEKRGVASEIVEAVYRHHDAAHRTMSPLARAVRVGDLVAAAIADRACGVSELEGALADFRLVVSSEVLIQDAIRGRNAVVEFLAPWGGCRPR